jgi:hypothetical protein
VHCLSRYVHYSLTKNSVVYNASKNKATGHRPVAIKTNGSNVYSFNKNIHCTGTQSLVFRILFTVLQYGGLHEKLLRQHEVHKASL